MKKTISVAEVPSYVPGENWLAYDAPHGAGFSLRGYSYAASDIVSPGLQDGLIVVYLDGSARMTRRVAGRFERRLLEPGKISLMSRKNDVAWSWDQPIRVLHLYVSAGALEGVCERMFPGDARDVELRNELELDDPVLHRIGTELATGAPLDGPGADLYAQALALQVCVHLLRRYVERPRVDVPGGGGLSRTQARRILELLDNAPDTLVSLASLAAELGVSEGHFIRLFKARFGVAPHRYLVRRRLLRSRDLLATDMTLAEVAHSAGFSDQSHFTRHFKREFATTPSAWRRRR